MNSIKTPKQYARSFIAQEFAGLRIGGQELVHTDVLENHLETFIGLVLHEEKGTADSMTSRIAKIQGDLFAIREDLRDTLDDARDARFVRLCAEIGALADEFLPEESDEIGPEHNGHDIEVYNPDCARCIYDDSHEAAAAKTMSAAMDQIEAGDNVVKDRHREPICDDCGCEMEAGECYTPGCANAAMRSTVIPLAHAEE